ncbi:MAG: hypothetical protein ABII12_02850 [Planctomycetota bacterium]
MKRSAKPYSVGLSLILCCLWIAAAAPAAVADEEEPAEATENTNEDGKTNKASDFMMKPTEVGVRFTPRMARAISGQFVKEMKGRYDLNDAQVESIRGVISRQMMKVVSENAKTGRDIIETMMETMIENDGQFPKDAAMDFAKLAKPIVPALKKFFADTSGEISAEMTIKQRLKFTGDVAAATAGLIVFEDRMKRWEEGKVGDGANPFYDPIDKDPEAASQPDDPGEHPEYRQARQGTRQWMEWQFNVEERWGRYVDFAIEFYGLDEAQTNAVKAILKECTERAAAIKTPEWTAKMTDNRIAQRLSWRAGGAMFSRGPWMFMLDSEYEKLKQPLDDLELELKRRLSAIPDSTQRAKAMESVRETLAEKGLERLPIE